eukprot:GHUV01042268.1.p1 GENE.GHUV01042268.1~~GHUV01042268.1.p1  ORF type:complete len:150 (+),score=7.26 GHUV01042268.1:99-548(+)
MSLARLSAKAGANCALLKSGRCRPRFTCKATMSDVPTTFGAVQTTFFKHPSAAVPTVAIAALLLARSQEPLTLLDVPVAAGVVGFWLIQEWIVHKLLLHSAWEWAVSIHHTASPRATHRACLHTCCRAPKRLTTNCVDPLVLCILHDLV